MNLYVENLGAIRHLGFNQKLIFKIPFLSRIRIAPVCHISTQSGNAQVIY